MLLWILLLILGLLTLVRAADAFVDGAAGLAAALGVPTLVIALTVVAFGTSLPELANNLAGAFRDTTALPVGNVIGANIANLGLVLGVAALVRPVPVASVVLWREIPFLLAISLSLWALAEDRLFQPEVTANLVTRGEAIVLLIFFAIFLYYLGADLLRQQRLSEPRVMAGMVEVASAVAETRARPPLAHSLLLMLLGAGGLALGAGLTVRSGLNLSRTVGLAEALFGATVIALGTTLPELVTSAVAVRRGAGEVAIGNAVGSAIFNTAGILGIAGLLRPLHFDEGLTGSLVAFIGLCALFFLITLRRRQLERWDGLLLLACYLAYLACSLARL